uniref:SJCHGC03312 protein n=1 Tax=Schistosoma japonicum TaxID=6182 RepID=Q5BST3_SCHJA|nr:SJCHGC03312 protein [Schistosoma japonicum]
MLSNFTLDSIHPTSQLYPTRSFNNHPQNTRHYPINSRHNYHTTTTTQNHLQFPRPSSNHMKLGNDPLFSNRRRPDRDEDRDIYSMLGV